MNSFNEQRDILVQVEQVSKTIVNKSSETTILDSKSISIPRGSLFAINGPSGSGKSTLLNMLTGIDLGGFLPRAQWRERAMQCLELVGLTAYAKRLPSEISGGQQQRVAIARALANNPAALIADEPTGNLDSKTALQVFSLLEELTRLGKTVIYVTHDRDLAARATRRVDLLDGRVVSHSGALL